jgi:integrase
MAMRGHGEGSIYKRKDGHWAASITMEGRKRKTLYGKTRKEVQEQLNTALHQQQQGTLVTTPQQKVEQFLVHCLEDVHKHSVRPRTYERYEAIIRLHLVPGLGPHPLQKLSPQHLQAFYSKKLDEGLSPTMVLSFHKMLHLALDKTVQWGLVPRNVCDAVEPPHVKRYEIQPLNSEQIQQFLTAARGHRLEALFVLALATGMRRGELLALKWRDINFATGTLRVRRILTHMPAKLNGKGGYVEAEPKTEKSRRSITLAPFALEKLKQHRVRQVEEKLKAGTAWTDHDLVFSSTVGGHLHTSRILFAQFKQLLKEADLPDIRFHDLRHSSATMLLSLGVHPKVVQEILGHSQISMTMDIYSHVLPTMQRETMSKLNDALQG